jgi:gas vesicle protein
MFSRVRIAIRFFFVGLAAGILLAPRSGDETRRLLRERADRILNDVLDAATLGTNTGVGTGANSPERPAVTDADAADATTNGGTRTTRSRSRATTGSAGATTGGPS